MRQKDIMVRVNRDTHAWLSQVRRELSVRRGEDLNLTDVVALSLKALEEKYHGLSKIESQELEHA